MSIPPNDEASLKGLGAEILLPARGNPFEKAPAPLAVDVLAVGAERMAPEPPAAPPPAAAKFSIDTPPASLPSEVSMPEPRDLTPEDLMALFPSSHEERLAAPAAAGLPPDLLPVNPLAAAPVAPPVPPPAPEAAAPLPPAEPPPDKPLAVGTPPAADIMPTTATESAAPPAPVAEATPAPAEPPAAPGPTPVEPTPPALPVATPLVSAAGPQPAEPPATPPLPAAPAPLALPALAASLLGAAAAHPAQPPRGMRAVGGGQEISLNLANVGFQTETYQPGAALPANADLARMFVPDGQMMTLWLEIAAVEADVTATKGVTQKVASEMLDRLMQARNLLMNDRSQFEEAARQVAEVKVHLARFRESSFAQSPAFLSVYLIAFLVLVLLGVALGHTIAWDQIQILSLKLDLLWYTMLVGGLGGFTGAAYSLISHVARDRDYDPQFALWYYQNPWMGLVLGIFVYIAVYILMNVGSLLTSAQATAGSQLSTFVILFFAWLAGFKHNIAFDLADMALKKLLPPDNTSDAADAANQK